MSMPFYVSPEQLMKDRADFARKGIARGRSVVAVQYADGVLFVSENPSQALHKVSEIYDRIAFAAVGRYNEFENLRIAGVRLADMRGYSYDRRDVTGRGLANAYAQTLGTIFSSGGEKPYEVELFVAEVGDEPADDQIYRLTYDGQVADEHGYAVMGGAADVVAEYLEERYVEGASLADALQPGGGGAGPLRDRRPGHPRRGPRGRRPRPHPQPATQVPPDRPSPPATAARRPRPLAAQPRSRRDPLTPDDRRRRPALRRGWRRAARRSVSLRPTGHLSEAGGGALSRSQPRSMSGCWRGAPVAQLAERDVVGPRLCQGAVQTHVGSTLRGLATLTTPIVRQIGGREGGSARPAPGRAP